MTQETLQLSQEARRLLAAARELLGGREGYLVGGSLRDALLGRPLADLDLAVAGPSPGRTPAFARELADRLGGHYVLLDAERGTARVALDDGPVRVIDVAALRGSIDEDLGKRDFTIDALAAPIDNIDAAAVIDPHGGRRDLERRTVRLVADQALVDDPLRLLRAVRLAVQLEFEIAPETAEALRRHAGRLNEAAAERQRDELARCFATDRAAQTLRLLDQAGLLEQLFPEITAGRGVTQPKEHYHDVFDHNIETVAALDWMLSDEAPAGASEAQLWRSLWQALDAVPGLRAHLREELSEGRSRAALLKVAGLLHDVAKPETRAPDETGRIRFFGHSARGAAIARDVLRRLRFGKREIELAATMVEEHLRPGQLGHGEPPSRRALYRFFRDTGEAAESVLLLFLADGLAARGPGTRIETWQRQVAYVAYVLTRRYEDSEIVRPSRLLSGEEIMAALQIAPGPEVGRLLAALEEAQASGDIAGRDAAVEFVRRLHDAPQPALAAVGERP
jgi:putative nucleotidyltransferase with HDIG domain